MEILKADWDGMPEELAATTWDNMLDPNDPELSCTRTTKHTSVEHQIPQRTLKNFIGKPEWYREA